jgi:glycosyltransferase involved in cell wall biosynthesis
MMNFLFLARGAPHKGLPDLLRAFTMVDRSDWNLTVVGGRNALEAEQVEYLAAQLKSVRIEPAVRNDRVPALMRSADVVVVPSRYENFCTVALEAIACGRTVIGSRCGGIPDLVAHEWNGLLFPPGDSAALAASIKTLLNNPAQTLEFGRRGSLASRRFDWSVVVVETIQLLESIGRC